MGFYGSTTPGVPGGIKASPEEFRVREISSSPRPDPAGSYTVLRVESRGWEQHELADALARRLGLPPRSIRWSGTKDRRAVSERLFSYRGPPPEGDVSLHDAAVLEAYRARDGLVLGHHYGNAFRIRVGGLPDDPAAAIGAYRTTEEELRAAGGFPNFFGPQRFGEVRPVTHDVGRAIVRGRLEEAVEIYLTARPPEGLGGAGDEARAAYASHRDPRRALVEFPREYRFERLLLERLARGETPDGALKALPYELRRLFVHAYQAYLFNRYATARHAAGVPADRPVRGDVVLRVGRDGTVRGQDAVPVRDNVEECSDLVARGRAFVGGPLVGFGTEALGGVPGEILGPILEGEGIPPRGFEVPGAPELASRGAWRPLRLPVPPIDLAPDAGGVSFAFALPKGAYATVLLREFLKTGAAVPIAPRGRPAPT
jgi:tRNA pseudouridine13 synthase